MESAKIGPNSIIQTVEVLKECYGIPRAREILQRGGQSQLMENLPSHMIPEQEFLTLVQLLLHQVGSSETKHILRRSGQLTALYLLKHRIPQFFQQLVKNLPNDMGITLLLLAIGKNAWTFVGSGKFRFIICKESRIVISNGASAPIVEPETCSFYAGTFEKLFQMLIDPQAEVHHIDCQSMKDVRCAYSISYGRK